MPPFRPSSSALRQRASLSTSQSISPFRTLIKRQSTPVIIPTQYGNLDSMPPGSIIGIVLGSVAGFLLLLLLIYILAGGTLSNRRVDEEVVVRERKRSRRTSSRRSSRTEPRIVPVVERERIIVEERRESRPAPATIESSSVGSLDRVVVLEDESPPRRTKSKRGGGYRPVDPLAYGGGDRPFIEVDRRGSRGSRRSGN